MNVVLYSSVLYPSLSLRAGKPWAVRNHRRLAYFYNYRAGKLMSSRNGRCLLRGNDCLHRDS